MSGIRDLHALTHPGIRRVYADDVAVDELESDETFTVLGREEVLVARA